jgi:hypothetical protein
MKHPKKLHTKNFATRIVPLVAIVLIGGIGSYTYLRSSSASVNYASLCGSGYELLNSTQNFHHTNDGALPSNTELAQLSVYRNVSAQKLCVITSKTKDEGKSDATLLARVDVLRDSGSGNWQGTYSDTDKTKYITGKFKYYAGPVYLAYDSIGPLGSNDYVEVEGDVGDYQAHIDYKLSSTGALTVSSIY